MRRTTSFVLSLSLAVAAAGSASVARAESVQQKLARARADRASAQTGLARAQHGLESLVAEYARWQARLAPVARRLAAAYQAEETLSEELAQAQQVLDDKVTQAYELGPGAALEMFLGSSTPSDFASAQVWMSSAFAVDDSAVSRVAGFKDSLAKLAGDLEDQQRQLAAGMERLASLGDAARAEVATAKARAGSAGLAVRRLEREERALEAAQAAAYGSLAGLVDPSRGKDQSALLKLLGPTRGRTCQIPDGLVDTGRDVDGVSSWYGWDFAGQHTASGAIYDPRLFTLANKELPLGVFLRIHYKGKCAIALVNDRGPYGVQGRIFDVSEAIAEYLGYKGAGVAYVTTDVLVPAR